jgi:hypothetical protein
VRFARANAGRYGLDPGRIGVIGFSAGGHLASMAATLFGEQPAGGTDDAVDRTSGGMIVRRFEPRRPGDPDALVADNGRILRTTRWRPRFDDLDKIVAHALAWERMLGQRSPS